MKRQFILFLFTFFLILLFGSIERVLACSCSVKKPICEAFGNAKAIFVGEVIEGKGTEKMSDRLAVKTNDLIFVFRVNQSFLGVEIGEKVSVHTGFGFGDCGFPFQKGETYLVYAYESNGKLQTSICTRTRPVAAGEDDFDELRNLMLENGAKIYGTVTEKAKSSLEENSEQLMSNLKLQIEQLNGEKKTFEVITDKQGKYKLNNLLTGRYKVVPFLPNGLKDEFLLNDKGCAEKSFYVKNDSLITGKVIDADGNAVKSIWVEIISTNVTSKPARSASEFGLTDSDGTFRLYNIPVGKYIIGFNYVSEPVDENPFPTSFYKNVRDKSEATIIDVELGQKIENLIIRLPPRIEQKKVRGVVVWADGKPAADIYIGLRDTTKDYSVSSSETDKLGRFTLKGFAGKSYIISAGKYEEIGEKEFQSSGESSVFLLDENTKSFRIALSRKQVK